MSLPKFVIGMVFAIAIVAVWSYFDSASIGTVLLRLVACAVILQVGYFLVVFAMVLARTPGPAERERTAQKKGSPKVDELKTKGT